jgi:uncharacterized membrane protein YphA (DoxX/SURF4 family)
MIDIGILILRIGVGLPMAGHGLAKFLKHEYYEERWNKKYGFPKSFVLMNAALQLFGGLIILFGIFTQVTSLILFLEMAYATWLAITKNKETFLSSPVAKGWDLNFTLVLGLFALVFFGDGSLSLSGLLS